MVNQINVELALASNMNLEERDYWLEKMMGEITFSNIEKSGKTLKDRMYDKYLINITEDMLNAINTISAGSVQNTQIIFMSTLAVLLEKYTNNQDILFGTVLNSNNTKRTALNMELPIRLFFDDKITFKQLNFYVKETFREASQNSAYAMPILKQQLGYKEDIVPWFNICFIFDVLQQRKELVSCSPSLIFNIVRSETGYLLCIEFDVQIYSKKSILWIANHYLEVLAQCITYPDKDLSKITMLSSKEREIILYHFNQCNYPVVEKNTIISLLNNCILNNENMIAVIYGDKRLTYKELGRQTNALAWNLVHAGGKPGDLVGVMLPRSIELIIGIIAILKTGGTYVPIDNQYPEKRVKTLVQLSDIDIILTANGNLPYPEYSGKVFSVYNMIESSELDEVMDLSLPELPAYIIFTSGSTGEPKGVVIQHKAIVNTLIWRKEYYCFSTSDTVLQIPSVSFDSSVEDIFTTLISGAKLIMIDESRKLDINYLSKIISAHRVTHILVTPVLYGILLRDLERNIDSLRFITVAGESFSEDLVKQHFKKLPYVRLYNEYGPSENSVCSTVYEFTADSTEVLLGKPISNVKCYVLDENYELSPIGIPGELYLSGRGLSCGYKNNLTQTEEHFIHDVIEKGDVLYKSGDIVCWTADGNLKFIGRNDQQIKLRGYRIELGEIERHINNISGVSLSAVLLKKGKEGEQSLWAFIESKEMTGEEVRGYLNKILPDYMLPDIYVLLDKMPLLFNGKIDRKALSEFEHVNKRETIVCFNNDIEKKLYSIWQDVLGNNKISRTDNFFSLGGNSIKVLNLLNKVKIEFHVEIEYSEFVKEATIVGLAKLIDQANIVAFSYPEMVEDKVNLYRPFSLTDVQMAYWLGRKEQFELGGVSTHFYQELDTTLDFTRLNQAINQLIKRHRMLQVVFTRDGKQKFIEIPAEYIIDKLDIQHFDEDIKQDLILKQREVMSHQIFDTSTWPLFDIRAFQVEDHRYRLFVSIDILLMDGKSMEILSNELILYYFAPNITLPSLQFTFRDYMIAYDKLKKSEIYFRDRTFWQQKCVGLPPAPQLPLLEAPSVVKKPRFKSLSAVISSEQWNGIKKVAEVNQVTIASLLLAAYGAVLSTWSCQQEMTINVTVFNRYPFHEQVERLIGDFTSLILVKLNYLFKEKIINAALRIQDELMENLQHRHYDGVSVIREILNCNNQSGGITMPVVFTCAINEREENIYQNIENFESWKKEFSRQNHLEYTVSQTSQVYLDNKVKSDGKSLHIMWDYIENILEEETVLCMFDSYINLLKKIAQDSNEVFTDIQLPQEDARRITLYNDTDVYFPRTTVVQMIWEQTQKTPQSIAVIDGNDRITYQRLDEMSNQIAHYLLSEGIGHEDKVCILGKRCLYTIVNLMGVLKAGAAYIPVDPEYPQKRKDYIMAQSGCHIALTPFTYEDIASRFSGDNIGLPSVKPEDEAYIIYTSGSTGKPKGVVITHGMLVNTLISIQHKYMISSSDRILGISSLCFDLSVFDIFGAFTVGAALSIVRDPKNMKDLIANIKQNNITIWNSVPAIMELAFEMMRATNTKCDSLRLIMLSGDWVSVELCKQLREYMSGCELVSLGGATEASIWSIYFPVCEIDNRWKSIPYGYPLDNQKIYILNQNLELVPVGIKGEICIGGVGVAKGYYNDAVKTTQAFIEHPQLGRIYRTGDYGIMCRSGYVIINGRMDNQVKVSGHRIELGEIENCLSKYPDIKKSVVICKSGPNKEKVLIAYFTADKNISLLKLKNWIRAYLPIYMIPSHFVQLDKIPLNLNGKVDRARLSEIKFKNCKKETTVPLLGVQKKIADIWSELLNIDIVGSDDNFFDLGGNSLLAIQLEVELRKAEYQIDYSDIYRYSTVRELAEYIENGGN